MQQEMPTPVEGFIILMSSLVLFLFYLEIRQRFMARKSKKIIPKKTLRELPLNEAIFIVSFTEDCQPVFKTVEGMEDEMAGKESPKFILSDISSNSVEVGKSYCVCTSGKSGARFLERVAIPVNFGCILGC